MTIIPWKRECPKCGNYLYYENKSNLHRASIKNSLCSSCGLLKLLGSKESLKDRFLRLCKDVHGKKYDYSQVVYKNNRSKVIVVCDEHGYFEVSPDNHVNKKSGCPKCAICKSADKRRFSLDWFIENGNKIHDNKFDYSKSVYHGVDQKLCIICPNHGEFWQTPSKHIFHRYGCIKCGYELIGDLKRKSTEQFILDAIMVHGDKYNYKNVEYKGASKKVKIICKLHGDFFVAPTSHLNGTGCPDCYLKNEFELFKIIKNEFVGWEIIRHKKIWDKFLDHNHRRYCDFLAQKDGTKIIIEYDGQQHFRPISFGCHDDKKVISMFERQQKIDRLDKIFCDQNGILLWRVKYNDDKIESINKLKGVLKNGRKKY